MRQSLLDQLNAMSPTDLTEFTQNLIHSLVAVADGKTMYDLIDDGLVQREAILVSETTSKACEMLNKESN